MKRALRVDKITIAALFEVLKLYLDPDSLNQTLPTLKYLTRRLDDISQLAETLLPSIEQALSRDFEVTLADCESQIGSGSLPLNLLASRAIKITPRNSSDTMLTNLSAGFRSLKIPVLGRIHAGSLYFDLRTLDNAGLVTSQLPELIA